MTRIRSLRERLRWPQWRMAEHLGCAQSTIARLEGGQKETGPVSRLLDALAQEIDPSGADVRTLAAAVSVPEVTHSTGTR